ncbi:hypothetical protein [Burkholderia pyrrocinia]|uniref:hypothetical protein n=1 Tax=Burkholderia pyrrocinia TaxID=60550 RepID=UPI002AB1DF02|nr:hypothetical protein [Burkholderia pyrrocinia]
MRFWMSRYVFMDAASEGGGTGGGGAGTGGGEGGAGGDGAAGAALAGSTGGDAGGEGGGSALAAGAPGAGGTPDFDFLPEKFRVNKEDGTFDIDSSSRRMADAYKNLERRIGEAPPAEATDYKVTVPDTMKDAFDPATDEGFRSFAGKMHGLGLSQKQLDGVMESYFDLAPKLVAGAAMLDEGAAKSQLERAWASQGGFAHQVGNAYKGASVLAAKAGLNIEELMQPGRLGNNVDFLMMMAAIAPEFGEDNSVGGVSIGGGMTEEKVEELMRSNAYTNTRNPDHERVSAQVRAWFETKHGTAAV